MRLRNPLSETREKIKATIKPPHPDTGVYYWVWGYDSNAGRWVVWGAFPTWDEADREGSTKLSGNYEVVPLDTRDEAKASRILRSKFLQKTGDTKQAFRRFKHTRGGGTNGRA